MNQFWPIFILNLFIFLAIFPLKNVPFFFKLTPNFTIQSKLYFPSKNPRQSRVSTFPQPFFPFNHFEPLNWSLFSIIVQFHPPSRLLASPPIASSPLPRHLLPFRPNGLNPFQKGPQNFGRRSASGSLANSGKIAKIEGMRKCQIEIRAFIPEPVAPF
jgi:hypothetical protein